VLPAGWTPAGLVLTGSSLLPSADTGGLAELIASGVDLNGAAQGPRRA